MNKKLIAATVSSILTIGLSSNAAAEIITFDGLAGSHMLGEDLFSHNNFSTWFKNDAHTVVNGFNMTSQGVRAYDWDTGIYNAMGIIDQQNWADTPHSGAVADTFATAYNGTDYAIFTPQVEFNRIDSGSFTVNSVDIVMWQTGYGEKEAVISGNFVGGGSISMTINLADAIPNNLKHDGNDFVHYDLSGFANLSSITISHDTGALLAVDNIDYTLPPVIIPDPDPVSQIPEPSTYAMLLAGLGLVGFMVRRRKSSEI